MSYDLMVFNKDAAPHTRAQFMLWYEVQTDWDEESSYTDLNVCTAELKRWYCDMIKEFPSLSEFSDNHINTSEKLTEYVIGSDIIYCAFPWDSSQEAYSLCFALAQKYDLGFFDVSSDNGDVFISGIRI